MPNVTVDKKKCNGCGTCVSICPVSVFDLKAGKSVPTRMTDCIACRSCEINCPQKAIVVKD